MTVPSAYVAAKVLLSEVFAVVFELLDVAECALEIAALVAADAVAVYWEFHKLVLQQDYHHYLDQALAPLLVLFGLEGQQHPSILEKEAVVVDLSTNRLNCDVHSERTSIDQQSNFPSILRDLKELPFRTECLWTYDVNLSKWLNPKVEHVYLVSLRPIALRV